MKRVSAVLIAALTVASLGFSQAADDPAKTLQAEFQAAKASLAAGDLASAENHYIDTIALGLRQLAQLSLSSGQTDQASAYLDSALKIKPGDGETQADAAGVWFRKGEVAKAKALLKSAVAREPNHARARGLLGRIYVYEGDSENAIQELEASVDLKKDDFETGYFLGIAYLTAKKLPEAAAWFHELESKMGESAALHMLFGRAYLVARIPQQAIPEFRQAIKLDPTYPRAHGFLGYAYLEHFQEEGYPQARQEFEKELKLHPDEYQVQELLGIADVNLRDFPAAETALLHAARLHPQETSIYLYLGETYVATNRTKAAVEVLEKYASMVGDPGEDKQREVSRAYYLLGQSLRRLGRDEEAKKALARSQQIREKKFKYDVTHIFSEKQNPEDDRGSRVSGPVADLLDVGSPEQKQGAQAMIQQGLPAGPAVKQPASKETAAARQYHSFVGEILGSSYNDLGVMRAKDSKFPDAAEFFKQASLWKPDLAGLDRNWGLASFRAELYGDAVPPLERQLKAHPDDSFLRQILGLSYYVLENYPKVVEVLHPLLEHPPDDPGLLFAWGTALVRTRQSGTAAGIFRRLLEQNANNASVHLLLGKASAQQKDYPSALNELSGALRLDPKLPEAHYYAGLVYLHQNDFESAAREFRAELETRPSDAHTMYHLGYALLLEGQAPESVALFREVIKAIPDYEMAYFELGRALLQQEDTTGAIESLEAAKKLAPDHDAVYFQLSQAYRRAGRMQEAGKALTAYQKLIEANRQKKRESLEIDKP